MSEPWTYDLLHKLRDATDCVANAAQCVQEQDPPWSDTDHWIREAQARLHIARVDLAAARTAHAHALHDATVARATDGQLASDPETAPGVDGTH